MGKNAVRREVRTTKRWKSCLLLIFAVCMIPLLSAKAWKGTITASSLNMRKSNSSESRVLKTLREGTTVEVLSSSGGWYKVKAGGTTGYVSKKYVKKASSSDSSSSGKSSSSSSSSSTCSVGDSGVAVKAVQKKLKSLGYYSGSVDGDYGAGTKKAVMAFQKANGLKQTGNVNSATLKKMNSAGSSSGKKSSSGSSSGSAGDPCSPGDSGAAVRAVQKKLKSLGFYTGDVDGDYGNGTKNAVKAFQRANGLTANGVANSKTIAKMNGSGAKKASSGGGGGGGTPTESLNWFKHPDRIPHHATFKVKDIKTGKIFNVKRWTGANHADCEPATASDTKIMKSIYGHWSWKRRPILVKYNGHVYAASMNGMPHGTQTIKNNNFNGHFCIHFTGSKTHASKKVDSQHQSCIKTALKHTW